MPNPLGCCCQQKEKKVLNCNNVFRHIFATLWAILMFFRWNHIYIKNATRWCKPRYPIKIYLRAVEGYTYSKQVCSHQIYDASRGTTTSVISAAHVCECACASIARAHAFVRAYACVRVRVNVCPLHFLSISEIENQVLLYMQAHSSTLAPNATLGRRATLCR